jgi:hypothetical protein
MKCPNCGHEIEVPTASDMGKIGGASKSKAKQKAARENGKKGGRPKKQINKMEV